MKEGHIELSKPQINQSRKLIYNNDYFTNIQNDHYF